jgi:hypothetical protein
MAVTDEHDPGPSDDACAWTPGEQRSLDVLRDKLCALSDVLPAGVTGLFV